MTVQEAKKRLQALHYRILHNVFCNKVHNAELEALNIAIESMKEVEQYRALGTVEELKEAREKQVAKKPTEFNAITNGRFYALDFMCPSCNEANIGNPYTPKYCKHCGQALKWGEDSD